METKMKFSLCEEGKCSFISFVAAASVCFTQLLTFFISYSHWFIVLYTLIFNICLALYFLRINEFDLFQVSVRGGILGSTFGIGLLLCMSQTDFTYVGWYMSILAFFHWSEYFTTAVTNPATLTLDCYMLDHSIEYKVAAVMSWLEFFLEYHVFPDFKLWRCVSIAGIVLCCAGDSLRKASMFTATTNFNHYVQRVHQPGHQLVTHGVYALCRHPSYAGWFLWSIGTQLILCNPFCLVAYAVASWRFFNDRIFTEEIYLHSFFGNDFVQYQKRVSSGIPFIRGFQL